MTIEIWCFERSDKPHEKGALLHLARELNALSEDYLMICNPVLYGQEIDALVIKRQMVFVVEIKSIDGSIMGGLYGEWTVERPDGTTWVMNDGRGRNPFEQIQREYRFTLDFLKAHASKVMTQSEFAQNDFRKIRNVLIVDPHYDADASNIDLGKRDKWLNIVGLYDHVTEPFWRLESNQILISHSQAVALAQDVLRCRRDHDMERLVAPSSPLETKEEPELLVEDAPISQLDPESKPSAVEPEHGPESCTEAEPEVGLKAEESELTADFGAGNPPGAEVDSGVEEDRDEDGEAFRKAETDELEIGPPSPQPAPQVQIEAPPSVPPFTPVIAAADQVIAQVGETWKQILERLRERRRQCRYAPPLEYGNLIYALRESADNNVHHLTPKTIAPNIYQLAINTLEYQKIQPLRAVYQKHLTDDLQKHIISQGYVFGDSFNRLAVVIVEDAEAGNWVSVTAGFANVPPAITLSGPGAQTYPLFPGDHATIGRGDQVDWCVSDPNESPVASRAHCLVRVADDGSSVVVQDTNSTNGTWVDDRRVTRVELTRDAVILLGRNKADVEGPKIYVHFEAK